MINIRKINNRDEYNSFIDEEKEKLHIVKFGADWCGPCKLLEKTIANLDDEKTKDVLFGEVEICDEATEELAAEFGISNIPVMLYIIGGDVKGTTKGALRTNDIYNKINEFKQ